MTRKIALRELKKARSKISIFKACLDLIDEKTFKEVRLEDICSLAEISKVTFFKFFPRKEDLLIYFMNLWLTNQFLELKKKQLRGIEALRYLFQELANSSKQKPGLMLSLISFLAEERMHPQMPVLSEAEAYLLYPDQVDLPSERVPALGELFGQFLSEAKEDGVLSSKLDLDDMVKVMFSIFYGAYLTSHLYQEKDILGMYELHLRLLLKE